MGFGVKQSWLEPLVRLLLKQLLKLSFSISKYKRMLHGGEIKYCMWGEKRVKPEILQASSK